MRSEIEHLGSAMEAMSFWAQNEEMVVRLRDVASELVSEKGQHYADILVELYTARLAAFEASADDTDVQDSLKNGEDATPKKSGIQPTKTVSSTPKPKRQRDPDHLRLVAKHPCLICGCAPTHAHHVRYAEPRAMGKKVGDEWTVPLCNAHHDDLHRIGDEKRWWSERAIDPLKEAERLWRLTKS